MKMKFKKDRFNNAFPKADDVEKDDVLYDKIWNELLDSHNSYDDEELQRGFDDVRQRIKNRKKKRRAIIYMSVSSVASILIFVFIALKNDHSSFEITHVSNLAEMGVTKKDNQVQLYLGDSVVSNLEVSAIISKGDSDNVELKTNDGVSLNLGKTSIAKLYVPSGKKFNLELSDGTKVTLNSNTWLEYPTSFEYENERRIKINGEAYFDVKRDDTKCFCVYMPNGESIEVLGTSFNVSAYEEDSENIATLVTGKVLYSIPSSVQTVLMNPNEQLRINKATSKVEHVNVDARDFIKWKDGLLYFNNERLSVIAKQLSRMYGIEINVADKYVDYRFSGMISDERGIVHIMDLIKETSDIKCVIEEGTINLK